MDIESSDYVDVIEMCDNPAFIFDFEGNILFYNDKFLDIEYTGTDKNKSDIKNKFCALWKKTFKNFSKNIKYVHLIIYSNYNCLYFSIQKNKKGMLLGVARKVYANNERNINYKFEKMCFEDLNYGKSKYFRKYLVDMVFEERKEYLICVDGKIFENITLPDKKFWKNILIDSNNKKEHKQKIKLLDSEDQHRAFLEATGVTTTIIDENSKILYVNSCFEKMFGYKKDEVENKLYWQKLFYPESVKMMMDYRKIRLNEKYAPNVYEADVKLKDNTKKNVIITVSVIPGTKMVASSALDITELKQAKKNVDILLEALENAQESIVISDKNFIIRYANKKFIENNLESNEENDLNIIFKRFFDQNFIDEIVEYIKKKRTWSGYIEKCHKEKRKTLYGSISVFKYVDGEELFISIMQDVTEKLRLKEKLQRDEKLKAIGMLAGGISHDFNNILSPILLNAEHLRYLVNKNNKAIQDVNDIIRITKKGRDLVDQIFNLSGKNDREVQDVILDPIIEESIDIFDKYLPDGVKINYKLSNNIAVVNSNSVLIHRIVNNIINNAKDAVGERGNIDIDMYEFEKLNSCSSEYSYLEDGQYWIVSVKDDGPGISDQIRECIFDTFFSTKKNRIGSGLGLAIAKGAARSCGGDVLCENRKEGGANFMVFLPKSFAVPPKKMDRGSLPAFPKIRAKIMLVDDDRLVVHAVTKMLRKMGAEVCAHCDAYKAIIEFRRNPDYDLVITDYFMPEINGLELAKMLHDCSNQTPIILYTGFSGKISREGIEKSSIKHIVNKSSSFEKLINAVTESLHSKKQK
ncbi:PAS domain-containing hybrid sensor histidine kinase/response regulator [Desulfoplanes sp.]